MGVRPKNILFLWTDEQRPDTIGAYRTAGGTPLRGQRTPDGQLPSEPSIHTPHLDRLAAQGTLFERAYCKRFGRKTAARLPEEVGKPAFQAAACIRFLETRSLSTGGDERPFLLM